MPLCFFKGIPVFLFAWYTSFFYIRCVWLVVFCMPWSFSSKFWAFFSLQLYVVYMGSRGSDEPEEILRQNHQMLTVIHKGRYSLSVLNCKERFFSTFFLDNMELILMFEWMNHVDAVWSKQWSHMCTVIDMVFEDLLPSWQKNKLLKLPVSSAL